MSNAVPLETPSKINSIGGSTQPYTVFANNSDLLNSYYINTSGYATWFTAGGALRIAHYDVNDDVITRKL